AFATPPPASPSSSADLALASRHTTLTWQLRHAVRRRPGTCVTPYDADPALASRRTTPTRQLRHSPTGSSAAPWRDTSARSALHRATQLPGQRNDDGPPGGSRTGRRDWCPAAGGASAQPCDSNCRVAVSSEGAAWTPSDRAGATGSSSGGGGGGAAACPEASPITVERRLGTMTPAAVPARATLAMARRSGVVAFWPTDSFTIAETISSETRFMTLISGLIDGPAVSLTGSPTVSPMTVAAWASEPLPPWWPSSTSFLALSQAPPELARNTAISAP